MPAGLDWDLWLGTGTARPYVDNLVPFNWRGWWDYGTGALGDMGCHLMEAPFRVLNLGYASAVQASVGSVYVGEFKRGHFPESCPSSSHVTRTFPRTNKTKQEVTVHWMDGDIQPEHPDELWPNKLFSDGGNGTLFVGSKGKMMASTYGANPRPLPTSRTQEARVKHKLARVPGGADGHYAQWVEACLAGPGKMAVSSPFELAGPLTEALLMANLAIRGYETSSAPLRLATAVAWSTPAGASSCSGTRKSCASPTSRKPTASCGASTAPGGEDKERHAEAQPKHLANVVAPFTTLARCFGCASA